MERSLPGANENRIDPVEEVYYLYPDKKSVIAITMKLARTIGEDAAWGVAFKRSRNGERYRKMMARRKR